LGTICNLWYRGWTADWSEWTRPMGRLLILLTTLLVLVMPMTEHLCNWDHFLRGGQDVEFNLLAGLLFAAMVVLFMSGSTMQPLMTPPLLMRRAFATDSCRQAAQPAALVRRESSRRPASLASRSQWLDDPAPASGSGMRAPLRI
jgi:hypothetical protein